MAYRVTGEGYSAFFREQEDGRDGQEADVDDGYTCLLCNTSYEKDLQLAAELGKTLLERNKELESQLRQHQNVVEDQAQEIEYLRKQTAALREVNDSRLRIYEQLEISIAELETNNLRLNTQASNDKKHIVSLESQIEKLEGRCEELLRKVEDHERARQDMKCSTTPGKRDAAEMSALKEQLSELRTQNSRQAAKLQEYQSTIDTVTQENLRLEETVLNMQRKQDEMSVIDQVRHGEICSRCLRAADDMTSFTADDDDVSIIDSLINDDSYQSILRESLADLGENNPYRTLVEKYEALLKVQATGKVPAILRPAYVTHESSKCLSLQEELAMSGFSSFHREEDDGEFEVSQVQQVTKSTPDFSETETSSSGFADETMNKGTQTEATVPGAFLCSITDGDDCKFSIYDEASPIETRFRKTPEYKKLFREIFDVLKRAAEAKDEGENHPLHEDQTPMSDAAMCLVHHTMCMISGENLPLLEDQTPMCEAAPKVPPVTPAVEDVPELPEPEDAASSVTSEQPSNSAAAAAKRDILDSLAQGVGGHKKSRSRRRSGATSGDQSPVVNGGVVVSTKVTRRKNRDYRQRSTDSGRSTPSEAKRATWCGDGAPSFVTPTQPPHLSSASHEVARLKQLEKSYAEVLRLGRQHVNRK
uniref:Cerebellar degeneration-related protein 2-like n=1 Tax=Lygus hesperus TaxID=30085 RepID=A0A146LGR2_LYGHE